MAEVNAPPENNNDVEPFPIEPRYHPVNRVVRSIYDVLASSKLAMLLLVVILLSCLCGALFFKDEQARMIVYGSLWFNGFLVLLVINVAFCFFGRIWRRKLTVISFGMILFHLSFVAMFLAIVANSLLYFDGRIRLTEGETLSNSEPSSYDTARHGLLFSYSWLKGKTTLIRVHRGYKVNGNEKNIAYDISIAEGGEKKDGVIYINNKLGYKGVEYIRDQEGYSVLVIANNRQGNELFGIHIPLQSFKQKDDSYIYSTGSKDGPEIINYPPDRDKAFFGLMLDYTANRQKDRDGRIRFRVWPATIDTAEQKLNHPAGGAMQTGGGHAMGSAPTGGGHTMDSAPTGGMDFMAKKPLADGTVNVTEKYSFGEYQLSVQEVRYWVAMNAKYNPGKPVVLASLWVGLAGIIITTVGRMVRGRKSAVSDV